MNDKNLIVGIILLFFVAVIVTIFLPLLQVNRLPSYENTYRYSDNAKRGRTIYIREGCWYCHTQQVRPWKVELVGVGKEEHYEISGVIADADLGRVSDPRDYVNDRPHLLGTERTGPDLAHIASRKSEKDWHIRHHKDPRSEVNGSIMPSYDYLSEDELDSLVEYLLSLR